ncbi:MAG: UvrD-helicase domain-containing protein [Rickettsiales bacterium]|jgi:ATP-dependent helicase/nuclease subunit A|nr:UvrD-helicase domain-containing protein [Rickettsiales bacterium]
MIMNAMTSENKTILQPKFSPEQTDASNPFNNVWVQANAGTGKTSVLIRRLLKLLLSGAKPDSILCLTYTNAAAAEIRERILKSLKEFAMAGEAELKEKLAEIGGFDPARARELFYEYIDEPDALKIQTIHGFCQEILRRFAPEAGLNPAWTLMTDADRNRMVSDVFHKLWLNETDTELREAMFHIMEKSTEFGGHELQKLAADMYRNFFSLDFDIKGAGQFIETIRKSLGPLEFDRDEFMSPGRMRLRKIYGEKIMDICGASEGVKFATETAAAMIKFAGGEILFEEYRSRFITLKLEKSKHAILNEKKFGEELAIFVSAEQAELYNAAQLEAREELLKDTAALYILAAKFAEEFRRAKESSARLHYDDLILYTMRLFSSREMTGWVISQLDSRIRHLMVDEAQDTSPQQWEIVRSLLTDFFVAAGRPSVFVVGDPKQSIYSFQGASIESFFSAEEYIARQTAENEMHMRKIDFQKSYRTAQSILDGVDWIFNHETTRGFTKWKTETKHISGRPDAQGKIVLHTIIKDDGEDDDEEETSSDQRYKIYAEGIAADIKSMLGARPDLAPEDIMVLVKKRRPHARNMAAALAEAGVPVAGSDRMALAESLPVKDLLALMRFCQDPSDDFSLACALRSPLFETTEQQLYKLCRGREGTLFEQTDDPRLDETIEWSKDRGVYSFLMKVLDTDGRRENTIKRMGAAAIEPLEEFLTLALSFERTQAGGIAQFIDWFMRGESVIKRDMAAASGVRIMTAYGAKGLEARVVFLVDTAKIKGRGDVNPIIPACGRSHWVFSNGRGKTGADYKGLRAAYDAKELEEYYRLLYVASTRARDELHIYGFAGARGAAKGSWFETLSQILPEYPAARTENGLVILE